MSERNDNVIEVPEPKLSRFVFADVRFSFLWFLLRLYVGYEWFAAGLEKVANPAWVGSHSGAAISGFFTGALKLTGGANPAVSGWYAFFIQNIAQPHAVFFSYLITYGELAVGVALVIGAFTGIAAFLGILMNFNYLFAGSVSINPLLLLLELFLILAWRNAGWLGVDRYLLPSLGVPWHKGQLFKGDRKVSFIEALLFVAGILLVATVIASFMLGQ